MTTQSEAQLEVALVRQLVGQGFRLASIQDGDDLLLNLKEELEAFNGHRYSDREFKKVLNHLSKGNFFTKAENLRDRFQLDRDDGTTAYLQFFDSDKAEANRLAGDAPSDAGGDVQEPLRRDGVGQRSSHRADRAQEARDGNEGGVQPNQAVPAPLVQRQPWPLLVYATAGHQQRRQHQILLQQRRQQRLQANDVLGG